jgi:glutamyl-tRNA synthetase
MSKVRVRYAPSPTGIPHIGNIRTALYNFLFARNQSGDFILRVEDTDQKRIVPESIGKIRESLKVLGLIPDEEEHQSKRLQEYKNHLEILKKEDKVYKFEGAWKFKVEKSKKLTWKDVVHSHVEFSSDIIEDFIIIKSDGFPTYHFASVVDDHLMKISHVFRGDEWISSTPKHLLLYEAFGWDAPKFVHMPPILGPNKKKLSKREGAKSVIEYVEEGYLPEALVNFLAFLGWSPKGNQEIFGLEELIKEFSLDRINKNSPIFNLEKLDWFNGKWIRKLSEKKYIEALNKRYPSYNEKITSKVALLTQDRISNLKDYSKIANFFYNQPKKIPSVKTRKEIITNVGKEFLNIKNWNSDSIKQNIDKVAEEKKIDRIELITSIRNIVSGQTITPPLYESIEKLGKEETVKRLEKYAKNGKD